MMLVGPHLQGTRKEHKLIVSKGSNQNRGFRVRCKCMAEYARVSDRYFNYDTLTDNAQTVEDIARVYREHLKGVAA